MRTVRIGTRGSRLAVAQATWVQDALHNLQAGLRCTLVTIRTAGDRIVDRPLRAIGGKGLFVKEIEEALLADAIDCAVHSMKDLPAELAPGLVIAAVPAREDARDLIITRRSGDLASLPTGGRVGTGSLRRTALLRRQRTDLEIVELRGNVDTRLRKLDAGDLDAVVLAAAGLKRLGIEPQHASAFDPREFVPAIGQGALAIECRAGELESVLAALDDEATRVATTAERAFLARIGGSCHTPLGAHAVTNHGQIDLNAVVASPDGSRAVRGGSAGAYADAHDLGRKLAEDLLNAGAEEILASLEAPFPAAPLDHP